VSAHAAPTEPSGVGFAPGLRSRSGGIALPRPSADAWTTLGVGAVLAAIAFVAGGGLSLGSATPVEMTLTLAGGAGIAAATVAHPSARPLYGAWAAALMLALAALTAVSLVWSVKPDDSWQEASRTLAYAASFCLALAWARAAPERWPAILGGVILAAVAVSGYALLTKVFPGRLNPGEIYARLREPYGYWNAIGLTAALGVPACLWLGARRSGHAALNALAYPAVALLLVTLMLAYSRGALLALALGLLVWFTAVPLRLRGAAVLLTGVAGAAVIVLWAFSQSDLTQDRVPLDQRVAAGHQLGILLVAVLIALLVGGLALNFLAARAAPSEHLRRQTGIALLVALALVPVAFATGLAASHRGLVGSITHAASSLTDPHAKVPPNDPSRLTAIGSVRARYWNDALKAFKDHPVLGNGAGGYATARLRYRQDTLDVQHAHGYIVQTLADLGLVGLAVSLALLAAWLAAAVAASRPYGLRWAARGRGSGRLDVGRPVRRDEAYSPERVGLLTMLAIVVVFGVHSLVDWTWFVPGNACVALLCAGWLAGRGPLAPAGETSDGATLAFAGGGGGGVGGAWRARGRGGGAAGTPGERLRTGARRARDRGAALVRAAGPVRLGVAAAIVVVALLATWAEWQPLRSVYAGNDALGALNQPATAQADLQNAINRDPVSVEPLFELAAVQSSAGRRAAAHATLIRAVRLQPSNPQTWGQLAGFDLYTLGDAKSALADLRAALYLDPQNTDLQGEFVAALRKQNPSTPVTAAVPPVAPSNPGPVGPGG
jgi:cytochrome c-type biogenesis protein CcmH/NrfG